MVEKVDILRAVEASIEVERRLFDGIFLADGTITEKGKLDTGIMHASVAFWRWQRLHDIRKDLKREIET